MHAKRRFINKFKIEKKLMATYLGIFLGSFLVYMTINLLLTYFLLSKVNEVLGPQNQNLRDDLSAIVHSLVLIQIIIGFLYAFATGLIFVTYVHRIFGAIYAIKNYLKKVIEGAKPAYPLTLRKGDQLQELASYINQILEKR